MKRQRAHRVCSPGHRKTCRTTRHHLTRTHVMTAVLCVFVPLQLWGCDRDTTKFVGVRLTANFDESLALDQLRLTGTRVAGDEATVIGPLVRPEAADPGLFADAQTSLVVLLNPAYAESELVLDARGLRSGEEQAIGFDLVKLRTDRLTDMTLQLYAPSACDGSTCCTDDGQCDDDDACTSDSCGYGNRCVHASSCCVTDADCADSDPLSIDLCVGDTCRHITSENCAQPCVENSDCGNDGDSCTVEICESSVDEPTLCTQQTCCVRWSVLEVEDQSQIKTCAAPCSSHVECDDHDDTTRDLCDERSLECVHIYVCDSP